jgi:hypothetical protein
MRDFPARASATRRRWDNYQHHVTNQLVDLDGDVAHAESYFFANLVRPDQRIDLSGGRYLDRLEKRDGEWGIVDRITIVEWAATIPADQAGWLPADLFTSSSHDKSDPSYRRPLKVTRPDRDLSAG